MILNLAPKFSDLRAGQAVRTLPASQRGVAQTGKRHRRRPRQRVRQVGSVSVSCQQITAVIYNRNIVI